MNSLSGAARTASAWLCPGPPEQPCPYGGDCISTHLLPLQCIKPSWEDTKHYTAASYTINTFLCSSGFQDNAHAYAMLQYTRKMLTTSIAGVRQHDQCASVVSVESLPAAGQMHHIYVYAGRGSRSTANACARCKGPVKPGLRHTYPPVKDDSRPLAFSLLLFFPGFC